ncbi:MAG: type II toxin-antitoxin system VapC family toxin [Burkholderiaceae bacterium]|jgi:tRNA(fMet)-specific endonuclease VapC|nr:type II toxin-antitoxin system VapC family toxin [Burkholderiaceae bacterium]
MAMRYMLDTNILGYFIQGTSAHLLTRMEQALRERTAAISIITLAETRYGQRLLARTDRRQPAIDQLLDKLPALPWGLPAAEHYAAIKAHLRQAGTPIGELDTQIAAHALAEGLTLVTHNRRHFERIEALAVEDWREDAG